MQCPHSRCCCLCVGLRQLRRHLSRTVQVSAGVKVVCELLLASSAQQGSKAALASTQAQKQLQRGLLLDAVVSQREAILQLPARKDEALLAGGDALAVLQVTKR